MRSSASAPPLVASVPLVSIPSFACSAILLLNGSTLRMHSWSIVSQCRSNTLVRLAAPFFTSPIARLPLSSTRSIETTSTGLCRRSLVTPTSAIVILPRWLLNGSSMNSGQPACMTERILHPSYSPQGPKGQRIRTVLVNTSPVESVVATRRLSRCVRPRLRPVSRARATN